MLNCFLVQAKCTELNIRDYTNSVFNGYFNISFIYWSPAIAGLFVCSANCQDVPSCVGDVTYFAFFQGRVDKSE